MHANLKKRDCQERNLRRAGNLDLKSPLRKLAQPISCVVVVSCIGGRRMNQTKVLEQVVR